MRGNDYEALIEFMSGLDIVDSHEHLPAEAERLARAPDFSLLFSHYCLSDLWAAGMTPRDTTAFLGDAPLDEKWRLFAPWYRLIQDGSYCRAAHLAMARFYGIARLESLGDAEALTAAMRQANVPGLYRRVLKDACRIRTAMNFGALSDDREFFAPVLFCTHYAEASKATIQGLEEALGTTCSTLGRYVEAVREELRRSHAQGLRGLKLHFAYLRDLHFAPQTTADAERVFQRILEEGYGWRPVSLGYAETRPLQDYMVHRLVEIATELDVPVVFHTGLQAHTGHRADDARPLRLWNLPQRHRRARFVVLHSGMPWLEEAALLAKHYPNCWLDMGWDHLMSPVLARRALSAWIDLVPMNKIFGFGGDYAVVEKVYGHLVLARQDIAAALAGKMARDGMPRARAEAWIRALLMDNPTEVYRLA